MHALKYICVYTCIYLTLLVSYYLYHLHFNVFKATILCSLHNVECLSTVGILTNLWYVGDTC